MQWELESSGLGIDINGEKLCGLIMFADDICLMVSPKETTQVLEIIERHAQLELVEFSGEKSIILPIGHKPNAESIHLMDIPEIDGTSTVKIGYGENRKYPGNI